MKLCPYCNGYLNDGEHTVDIFTFGGEKNTFIGCPKHPKKPEITVIDKSKFLEIEKLVLNKEG